MHAKLAALPVCLGCILGATAQIRKPTSKRGTMRTPAPSPTSKYPSVITVSESSLVTATESLQVLDQNQDGCISAKEFGYHVLPKIPKAGSIDNEFDTVCQDVQGLSTGRCGRSKWTQFMLIFTTVFASSARMSLSEVWVRCVFGKVFREYILKSDPCLGASDLAVLVFDAAKVVRRLCPFVHKAFDIDRDKCYSKADQEAARKANNTCLVPQTNATLACDRKQDFCRNAKIRFESAVFDMLTLPLEKDEKHAAKEGREAYGTTNVLLIGGASLALCFVFCSILCWWRRRNMPNAPIMKQFPEALEETRIRSAAAAETGDASENPSSGDGSRTHSLTCNSAAEFAACNWEYILARSDKDHWLVAPDELSIKDAGSFVKSGGFGSVRRGLLRGITQVAVKQPLATFTHHEVAQIVNEARLLRRMRHPNIVLFYGISFVNTAERMLPVLVLEFVDGGNFSEFVRSMKSTEPYNPETQVSVMHILLDVARALTFLHESKPPVLHLDIKPNNVLVESCLPRRGKVADFGLSQHMGARKGGGQVGTLKYMAPEIMAGSSSDSIAKPADVFSFGCVMIFAMLGRHSMEYSVPEVVLPVLSSENVPDSIKHMIEQCLALDTKTRPDFLELYERLQDEMDKESTEGGRPDSSEAATPSTQMSPISL